MFNIFESAPCQNKINKGIKCYNKAINKQEMFVIGTLLAIGTLTVCVFIWKNWLSSEILMPIEYYGLTLLFYLFLSALLSFIPAFLVNEFAGSVLNVKGKEKRFDKVTDIEQLQNFMCLCQKHVEIDEYRLSIVKHQRDIVVGDIEAADAYVKELKAGTVTLNRSKARQTDAYQAEALS